MAKTQEDSPPSGNIYRDFASEMSPVVGETAAGPGPDPPFPVKLHYVLEEVKKDGLDDIVSWQPHGRYECQICLLHVCY